MWTPITDCGKQITIHSRLREKDDHQFKYYDITEVEFDQYKLSLITRDTEPPVEELEQILTCKQLIKYGFEVEGKEV